MVTKTRKNKAPGPRSCPDKKSSSSPESQAKMRSSRNVRQNAQAESAKSRRFRGIMVVCKKERAKRMAKK